tara:strand:- start:226 stop:684 length:459 start_codon:yes stop_codon:yes gene_type:complete
MLLAKKHNQYPAVDKKTGASYTQYVYALTQITVEQLTAYFKYALARKDKSGKAITKTKLKSLVDENGNQLIWSRVSFPFGDSSNLPAFQKEDGNIQMDRSFVEEVQETVSAFKGDKAPMSEFKETYFSMKQDLLSQSTENDDSLENSTMGDL